MGQTLWGQRPRPDPGPDACPLGHWAPVTASDLTVERRELAAALHTDTGPAGGDEDAVERLLLAYEELASNALRHGRAPVRVTVTAFGTSWLLDVSDAGDRPPEPAVDRDAAQGGLGLYLVARICSTHGWCTVDGRKSVWACIDHPGPPALAGCGAGGSSTTN